MRGSNGELNHACVRPAGGVVVGDSVFCTAVKPTGGTISRQERICVALRSLVRDPVLRFLKPQMW